MTSTTTHSSHSSHALHSNSPTQTPYHTNSITVPTFTVNSHTATIGGVDWSGSVSSNTKIGDKSSTGSLTSLLGVVNNIRTIMTDLSGTPTSASAPVSGGNLNSSVIQTLITRSGGTMNAGYQPVTSQINTTTQNAWQSSYTGHQNTSQTSALTTPGTNINSHSNSINKTNPAVDERITTGGQTGCSYHHNTATHTGFSTPVKAATNTSNVAPTFTSGKKITKADFDAIVAALGTNTVKQWSGPASLSDNSWKLSGTNSTAIHASHSSHASHTNS